ncbi:putative protein [Arabidopsis thaliana]|uniref:RNA splicing factor-like protein n=3 Tax=Arabidopsis TaxID=3701 RepID=Q9LES8_ARATH|nr:RNA splicing factor-like protein [Arabidopsis thaliana]AEE79566.1 RNA splicing factor-like protein [Arabidopsis thaliana]KAG7634681.1 Pre-mRNA-splicing factor 3 [Arabidopsis suecica]CAC00742.1 putative protein [Arabidopsis thaliana]VYS60621.1 unnamed protein product [Arabidopsis thaliana]|eukprot:NP_191238.1 RNA splicing factor-like protein [Arabidopsis thaliana]
MDNKKQRYSRSIRDDRDERDRTKHHHERSHEGSKRKDRSEEENGAARTTNKSSRFEDVARFEKRPYTCSIASDTTSSQILEAVKRFQELAIDTAVAHKQTKGFFLRVDVLGREIDEYGHVINLSTLMVNNNKHKKDVFQNILKPPQPFKLTKKEEKKLQTLRRVAKEKEKQKMIRQALFEPQKSKVKLSNLMKVLASELATQDFFL